MGRERVEKDRYSDVSSLPDAERPRQVRPRAEHRDEGSLAGDEGSRSRRFSSGADDPFHDWAVREFP